MLFIWARCCFLSLNPVGGRIDFKRPFFQNLYAWAPLTNIFLFFLLLMKEKLNAFLKRLLFFFCSCIVLQSTQSAGKADGCRRSTHYKHLNCDPISALLFLHFASGICGCAFQLSLTETWMPKTGNNIQRNKKKEKKVSFSSWRFI